MLLNRWHFSHMSVDEEYLSYLQGNTGELSGFRVWHTIQFFFSTFNDIHLSFIIFQIEWFMQQKEKSYQLLSPRFNDLLFEEQCYLVSYSLFWLFSALFKKVRYFIDLLQLELAIIWLTKIKQTVHLFYVSVGVCDKIWSWMPVAPVFLWPLWSLKLFSTARDPLIKDSSKSLDLNNCVGVVVRECDEFLIGRYVLMTGPTANQNLSLATYWSDLQVIANQIIFHTFWEK